MIIVVSSVICLFVGHFYVLVHWKEFPILVCFGCRIVLVVMCMMLFKDPFGPFQKSF